MGKPQYLHLTPGPKRTRAEGSELRLLRCGLRSLAEVELRAPENQRCIERVTAGRKRRDCGDEYLALPELKIF